jgi:hypothetical protein
MERSSTKTNLRIVLPIVPAPEIDKAHFVQDPLVVGEHFEKIFLGGWHTVSVSNKVVRVTNLLRKVEIIFQKVGNKQYI